LAHTDGDPRQSGAFALRARRFGQGGRSVGLRRSLQIEPLEGDMHVRDGMSRIVLQVGPGHTLRAAARQMAERKVGAAVVNDPDAPGPGIITERDILNSVGTGQSPDGEKVADHLSAHLTFAEPGWSLERAAEAMVKGKFRHLVVVDGGELVGVLSIRDIVRCWVSAGATSDMPG
jgi:CBS domain-containing protein